MKSTLAAQIAELREMGGDRLRQRYREVLGDEPKTSNQHHLRRRIAWRLQAETFGDISHRSRIRAAKISEGVKLKGGSQPRRRKSGDRRVPETGTEITRVYRDRTIVVKILENGFECEGKRYDSLSAAATEATGTRWNGLVFFGLAKRGETAKRARKKSATRNREARHAA